MTDVSIKVSTRMLIHFFAVTVLLSVLTATVEARVTLELVAPSSSIIIENGTLSLDFETDFVPFLGLRDFGATFVVRATPTSEPPVGFSAQILKAPVGISSEELIGISSSGIIDTNDQVFSLNVSCSETGTVFYTLVLSLAGETVADPPETFLIKFTKECRKPGCSEQCSLHGTCEEQVGICHCEPNYHGEDCSIQFGFNLTQGSVDSNAACVEDSVTLFWSVPEDSASRFDWWGIYPYSDDLVFDANGVIYWEYLNSGSKRNGDRPNLGGNSSLVASLPQRLIVGLFYNDGYEPFGTFPFTFKNWSECRDFSSFDCSTQCQRNGTCPTDGSNSTICECPSGLFWYDCSLGCSGLSVLSTADGVFAAGGGKRPLPIGISGCEWLIAPPPPLTSISLSFDYFDISATDYLDIHSGNDSDSELIVSLSGPSLLQPIQLNSSTVYIRLRIAYGSQGYSGFQARWTTLYIKTNQVVAISSTFPAAIVFYVLISIGLLFLIGLLVFLARYKHFWIIRSSNASFLSLVVYGSALGYAAIPQFWGTPTVASCSLRFWFPSLGWVIMMGCYLIKSYRIHKIFSNKKTKPVVLTDARLLQYVGVMVLYEIVFLSIWTGVDTPIIVKQTDRLTPDTDYLVCSGRTTIFPILSLFSKVAMMIWGTYLSWKTRHVVELFSESRFIGFAIYSVGFTSIVFVPLLYILPEFQILWLVLACSGIVILFTLPQIIIFVRLFRFVRKYPDDIPQQTVRDMTLNHNMRRDSMRKLRASIHRSSNASHQGSTIDTTSSKSKQESSQ